MNIMHKTKSSKEENKQDKPWWSKGIRFECQGSGRSCVSHGEFGNVYLTLEDRQRMAKVLKMSVSRFTRKYCERIGGIYRLKEQKADKSCTFLEEKKCQIYEGRPTQCRTWPFWPEVMGAKLWKKEVADFCPGVGRGKIYSELEIRNQLEAQIKSEKNYGS